MFAYVFTFFCSSLHPYVLIESYQLAVFSNISVCIKTWAFQYDTHTPHTHTPHTILRGTKNTMFLFNLL